MEVEKEVVEVEAVADVEVGVVADLQVAEEEVVEAEPDAVWGTGGPMVQQRWAVTLDLEVVNMVASEAEADVLDLLLFAEAEAPSLVANAVAARPYHMFALRGSPTTFLDEGLSKWVSPCLSAFGWVVLRA